MKTNHYYSILLITFISFSSFSQILGGRENSQKSPSLPEAAELSKGVYQGNVNEFTGEYGSSIPLGTVSTPSGLNFSLNMSHGSSFYFGSNEQAINGLLYGDGWSLGVPKISVETAAFQRFQEIVYCNDNEDLNNYVNRRPSNFGRDEDGDIYWFSPSIIIPGVVSGNAIFRYIDESDAHCAVFALNDFSSPVEIRFYGSSWSVIVENGDRYIFSLANMQYAAPTNRRLFDYREDYNGTWHSSYEGSMILMQNEYSNPEVIKNAVEPKKYFNNWYCEKIINRNNLGEAIVFQYGKYGLFNYYKEFLQNNYKDVHKDVFRSLTFPYHNSDTLCYKDIILESIIASTIDGNIEKIVLEYGSQGGMESSDYLLYPEYDNESIVVDAMYAKKVVKRYGGTSNFNSWKRYSHAALDQADVSNVNSRNPYINLDGNFYRRQDALAGSLNNNAINFNHSFLESPRLASEYDNIKMIPGDIYEIKTVISRQNSYDNAMGNGTVDIALVSNRDFETRGDFVANEAGVVTAADYNIYRGGSIFSTFNMATKWHMAKGESMLRTSNFFMMPNVPMREGEADGFDGFNIQVGPGNSDINYSYLPGWSDNRTVDNGSVVNGANSLFAYPQLRATGIKSGATIGSNFGTGHPWGMMVPIYASRALGIERVYYNHLFVNCWMFPSVQAPAYTGVHKPTKFDESVSLNEVELVRHGRRLHLLRAVKKYAIYGQLDDNEEVSGDVLISQMRLDYNLVKTIVRHNLDYNDGDQVLFPSTPNKDIIFLSKVHNVPLNANLYASDFGLTNADEKPLTTEFFYTNIVPQNISYHQLERPYAGVAIFPITKVIGNLGGVKEIAYYPTSSLVNSSVGNGISVACGRPIKGFGVDFKMMLHLVVNKIKHFYDIFDEATQTYVPTIDETIYDYLAQDKAGKLHSYSPSFISNDFSFKEGGLDMPRNGFRKVKIWSTELITGVKNYTIKHYHGFEDVGSLGNFFATEDHLFYGKEKLVQHFNHLDVLHSEKEYIYGYTLAFVNGYERPDLSRHRLNTNIFPVHDEYEYKDYMTGVSLTPQQKAIAIGQSPALSGVLGYMEGPRFLDLYFYDYLLSATYPVLINDKIHMLPSYPHYIRNSYFVKLIEIKERVFDNYLQNKNPKILDQNFCVYNARVGRTFIETSTKFEYFEANYTGEVVGKPYELLLGMIPNIGSPSSFPKTYAHNGVKKTANALVLKYEPSWQLFSKTVTSSNLPGESKSEQYFYLYDLQNRYARHWYNYDLASGNYQTDVYNGEVYAHSDQLPDLHAPVSSGLPTYDGLLKSRDNNLRNIAFQKTTINSSISTGTLRRSEYYQYDARWNLVEHNQEFNLTMSEECRNTPPADPGTNNCGCFFTNHIFGPRELALLYMNYPLTQYCYYQLAGGWTYTYLVCPKTSDPENCDETIVRSICSLDDLTDEELAEIGSKSLKYWLIGDQMRNSIFLRDVYVQVDTIATNKDFGTKKWDSKNLYIADFHFSNPTQNNDGFLGRYNMILPFTSQKVRNIVKRNIQTLPIEEQVQTGITEGDIIVTKYYYKGRTIRNYTNLICTSEPARTNWYNPFYLPYRITQGANRSDSLSIAYSYTKEGNISSVLDANSYKQMFNYDQFLRLIEGKEQLGSEAPVTLASKKYSIWDRTVTGYYAKTKQNFVESRLYNSTNPNDYSVTRSFIEPLGRKAGDVVGYTDENNNSVFIQSGNQRYDKWGRVVRSLKNYVTQVVGANVMPSYFENFGGGFSEVQLENTPHNRQLKTSDFGVSIASSQVVRNEYAITNASYAFCELELTNNEILGYFSRFQNSTVYFNQVLSNVRYFRTLSLDQDGKRVVSYTNALGQKVGTISYLDGVNKVVTLFYYDLAGNVTKVINPKKQVSTYEYNLLDQLYREVTIEAGEKKFMYNIQGNVSLYQDQLLKENVVNGTIVPTYRKYEYDLYGRLTKVGLTAPLVHYKPNLYGVMHYRTEIYGDVINGVEVEGCDQDYIDCGFFNYKFTYGSTLDWLESFRISHYSQGPLYPPSGNSRTDIKWTNYNINKFEKEFSYGNTTSLFNRGRKTESRSYDLQGVLVQKVNYSYNAKGQVTQQREYFANGGAVLASTVPVVINYTKYSIQGKLMEQNIDVDNNNSPEFSYYYAYDGLGRLKTVDVKEMDDDKKVRVVSYVYNDANGTISTTKHHYGTATVTKTDNLYDIRERLSSTVTTNVTNSGSNSKLMQHFYYYDNQNLPAYNGNTVLNSNTYNGNIKGISSSYNFTGVVGVIPNSFNKPLIYGYQYDNLNRLINADGIVGDFVDAVTNSALLGDVIRIGDEVMQYDKIGNVTNLMRVNSNVVIGGSNSSNVISVENMQYGFAVNNRLSNITGINGTPNRTYTYDVNGNLKSDSHNRSHSIGYGRSAYIYALTYITGTGPIMIDNNIKYLYSVDDMRIFKSKSTNVVNGVATTDYYLYDALGRNLGIRRKVGASADKWEFYVFGNRREAKYIKNVDNGIVDPNELEFYLTDHLGNTRMVYALENGSAGISLNMRMVADYFPYGKVLRQFANPGAGGNEKFLSTDHERDPETDWDYRGARYYDSDVARFLSVDPLAEKYPGISPYAYVANNPLIYVDPDGRDIRLASEVVDGKTIITVTVTGKLINESGKAYTAEQMQAYTDRLVSSISSTYTGSDGDVSWKGVANITMASDDNPLGATDHAFRIVDQGKIPGAEGENGVLGMAPFGENVVYLSNHMLDRTQATGGTYAGTGKTDAGTGTLERTGPHELGHSGNLKHPTPGTMDGNLMHQTKQPNAGMKLTKDQILQMQKDYDAGKLNQGKQKIE